MIAIIAILAVVVVLTLNPAELLRQSRDANRVSDMSTLNSALGLYVADQSGASGFSLGNASSIYVSIPDTTSTCASLGLPSVPWGLHYACSASTSSRTVGGAGWVPVVFSALASGAPFSVLPQDPVNQTSSAFYYSYATDGTHHEVAAAMESQKYSEGGASDVASTDGGSNVSLLEKGTNLALVPYDYGHVAGLSGYWPLGEGTGTAAYDLSGGGNPGIWYGTPSGSSGYYSAGRTGGWAGNFNGTDDYLAATSTLNTVTGSYTLSLWMSVPSPVASTRWLSFANNSVNGFDLINRSNGALNPSFFVRNGGNSFYTAPAAVATGTWHYVVAEFDFPNQTTTMYIDGAPVPNVTSVTPTIPTVYNTMFIGKLGGSAQFATGLMSNVRVYSRLLSASEVQAFYAAGK